MDPRQLQDQLNASLMREQEKDIEIERLKTTCKSLTSKNLIFDQLHDEIADLRERERQAQERERKWQ